jgi:hypothetical protein
MRCTTNHGSLIRQLVNNLEFSWINIHRFRLDETQADRFFWCVREMSEVDESRLAHFTAYHWEEFLTALPQEMRHGYREFALQVQWFPGTEAYALMRAPWVIS